MKDQKASTGKDKKNPSTPFDTIDKKKDVKGSKAKLKVSDEEIDLTDTLMQNNGKNDARKPMPNERITPAVQSEEEEKDEKEEDKAVKSTSKTKR